MAQGFWRSDPLALRQVRNAYIPYPLYLGIEGGTAKKKGGATSYTKHCLLLVYIAFVEGVGSGVGTAVCLALLKEPSSK